MWENVQHVPLAAYKLILTFIYIKQTIILLRRLSHPSVGPVAKDSHSN